VAKCLGYTIQIFVFPMKKGFLYNRYKFCIHSAKWAFNKYNKYNRCYTIRSIDEEMQLIFRKIGLSYARLMQAVANEGVPAITNVIDECERLTGSPRTFFQKIISYLDTNRKKIEALLDREDIVERLQNDLQTLEKSIDYATKAVIRMEYILRNSQHLYKDESYHLKSA
jgi:hypothetical protein